MALDEKIAKAVSIIDGVMAVAKNPAIMCSFGKDSMVMLHLLRAQGWGLPVIFHREPFFPAKYRFANWVIEEWGLTVHDYPPSGTAIREENGFVEIANYYQIGKRIAVRPTGICESTDGFKLCALYDFYLRPLCGSYDYRWDVVFVGHKSTDDDPLRGKIPLSADYSNNLDCASIALPLRDFTDSDIWEYHERFKVPIHKERYEKTDAGWRTREDKTNNPDYFPACTACMLRGGGPVSCPRLGGATVSNVSAQLRWAPKEQLPYMQNTSNQTKQE